MFIFIWIFVEGMLEGCKPNCQPWLLLGSRRVEYEENLEHFAKMIFVI